MPPEPDSDRGGPPTNFATIYSTSTYTSHRRTKVGAGRSKDLAILANIYTPAFVADFRATVLEEKLIPRAPLRDLEPSRAANAISDVFLVKVESNHRHWCRRRE